MAGEIYGTTKVENIGIRILGPGDGVAGDQIRISILSTTFGLDPRLEIRDPDGAVIHDEACNGGQARLNVLSL